VVAAFILRHPPSLNGDHLGCCCRLVSEIKVVRYGHLPNSASLKLSSLSHLFLDDIY
jgi:hypothetical protein